MTTPIRTQRLAGKILIFWKRHTQGKPYSAKCHFFLKFNLIRSEKEIRPFLNRRCTWHPKSISFKSIMDVCSILSCSIACLPSVLCGRLLDRHDREVCFLLMLKDASVPFCSPFVSTFHSVAIDCPLTASPPRSWQRGLWGDRCSQRNQMPHLWTPTSQIPQHTRSCIIWDQKPIPSR